MSNKCSHTIFNPNCPSCQKLQAEWYSKLDPNDEIEDITIENDKVTSNDRLEVWHNTYFFQRHTAEKIEATLDYYLKASAALHTYKFKNKTHRKVWELFSEGWSKYEISKELTKDKRFKQLPPSTVLYIINQIKKDVYEPSDS